jgi:hypothetical protein
MVLMMMVMIVMMMLVTVMMMMIMMDRLAHLLCMYLITCETKDMAVFCIFHLI